MKFLIFQNVISVTVYAPITFQRRRVFNASVAKMGFQLK